MRIIGFRNRLMLYIATGALLLVAVGGAPHCQAQGARFGRLRIYPTVNPRRVPADGQTGARIRVEVRDEQGHHVPEGTAVVMHTDLGLLSTGKTDKRPTLTVRTAGGFAIAFATSNTPGTATVRITAQDSRNFAYIEFLPKGEVAGPEARVIDIQGGWVAYSLERNLVEARDNAEAHYGGMTVTGGDILQLDIGSMILKAEPTVINRGDQHLAGEDLYFDLRRKRGALRQFTDAGVERVLFDIYNLSPRELDWELPPGAFRFDDVYSRSWLVADRISVFMDEKIVLRHATVYIDGQKAMSLPPYWIIGMAGYRGASNTQVLGITSDGGLAVNFPFFYRVTDQATGAVEIQRGASAGSVIARPGWSLGLREEYRTGNVEGSIVASGLPRGDWGLQWRDSRPVFGGCWGDFSVGWPDHRNVFADTNVYNWRDSYSFNLRSYYNALRTMPDTYGMEAEWLTSSRPLSSDGRDTFRLGSSLGLHHNPAEKSGLIFDNEVYAELDFSSWRLGSQTWLTPTVSNAYYWDTADFSANSARGSLGLRKYFGDSVDLYVDYSAEYASGDAYHHGWRQVLSSYLRASGSKWQAYVSSSWDLTESDTYAELEFDYYLNDRWRLGLIGTYYQFDVDKFDDAELITAWSVWQNREIGLRYSQDSGKLSIELGGLGGTF